METVVMKVVVFDTHRFEQDILQDAGNSHGLSLKFFESRLNYETVSLATGADVVCCFVNDHLNAQTLRSLAQEGIGLIALRCAGFNNVDLKVAEHLGIKVVRVPAYSPHAVAEHAVAMILCLNRKIHRSYHRVRELNFSLNGLVGFDLFGKTVGVVGTGRIGAAFARIMKGFGCHVLAYSAERNRELEAGEVVEYCSFDHLLAESDIVSLHVPLTPETYHLMNEQAIARMKPGSMLINTGRGALIDTRALVEGLKKHQVEAAGLDVYEEEEGVFFQDLSDRVLQDDTLARLLTFPNVLVTAHQAFLTREALQNIASTTMANIEDYAVGRPLKNLVIAEQVMAPRPV